jgi:phosphoribosylformylglycinamidine cyclo-ligase
LRTPDSTSYASAGVDPHSADEGLRRLTSRLEDTWPAAGKPGAVQLPFGYFANVVELGGRGLAISTDGVGTKALIAQAMGKYDTIGIDCVAMNVNDIICVGATPVSFVDYIAMEEAKPDLIDELSIGLSVGATQGRVSIVGGELAQLRDMIKGDPQSPGYAFDIAGTAVGDVDLQKIIVGADLAAGDVVIGIESSGIHSNGLSKARQVLLTDAKLDLHSRIPELGRTLGEELLEPTLIYVQETLDILAAGIPVKALMHITGDGFLNLRRTKAEVGFVINALHEPPVIFSLIQERGQLPPDEMFFIFNMGIAFCVVVPEPFVEQTLGLIRAQGKTAYPIGHVSGPDPDRRVHLPRHNLISDGKTFRPAR